MKKCIVFMVMTGVLLAFSGCVYMDIKTPLDTDLDKTILGSKVGTASSQSVLWLFAWGDSGTKAASENGNITVINHMDKRIQCYLLGLYSKATVIVYGD